MLHGKIKKRDANVIARRIKLKWITGNVKNIIFITNKINK